MNVSEMENQREMENEKSVSAAPGRPAERERGRGEDAFVKGFAKGRRKANRDLLKSLGVESVEQAKEWMQERESLAKTRQELEQRLNLFGLEREAEREESRRMVNQLMIRQALERAALKEGLLRWEDLESVSLDGVTIDEEGRINGLEGIIARLKQEQPHLFHGASDIAFLDNTRPNGRSLTDLDIEEMGYAERVELYRRNPATYKKLKGN